MSVRTDLVRDLREMASYRVSFHNTTISETINCSNLVGNSASLGTSRIELIHVNSNVDQNIGIFNLSLSGTENLAFSTGTGETSITFSSPITDNSITKSSVVKLSSASNASGYVMLTFIKKSGFENTGSVRRKPNRPRPYRS